jgi:GMP synthase (glutamine-hydrolysing)
MPDAQAEPASIAPAHAAPHEKLLIVDFGSQVTQLIARRLRELRVYCEIHPFNAVDAAFLRDFAPRAVILSGGPSSVADAGSPRPPAAIFDLEVPVLGICYGQQAMVAMLGGRVERGGASAEFGRAQLTPTGAPLDLLSGWFASAKGEQVWMSHGDHVADLPPGFAVHATSAGAPFAVIADPARRFYGVQFHPEVHHTPRGATLYENFVRLAGFAGDWTMGAYRAQAATVGSSARCRAASTARSRRCCCTRRWVTR